MKRSEMIDIIYNKLLEIDPTIDGEGATYWDEDNKHLVGEILDSIEKAGMLPPPINSHISIINTSLNCLQTYQNNRKWEPEDDK